jgi:hypothetical protein
MNHRTMTAVQFGMDVYTSDVAWVGTVKSIREDDFLLDREHARDIYVPMSMVKQVLDGERRVELTVTEADFHHHDWEHPPLV